MTTLYHLSDTGLLCITGTDAIKFMQGYVTCDLTKLRDGGRTIGAVCNLQGRMLTSFLALRSGQDLWFRMQRSLVPSTLEFLKKYIVFSKAELHDISDSYVCYGSLDHSTETLSDGFIIELHNRKEIWSPSVFSAETNIGPWQDAEYSAGIAWVSETSQAEYLPQMFNYHNQDGIDFEKGCYLGQEIIARAQYRGELKRRLHRLTSAKARDIGEELDCGSVVATAPSGQLAVLKNTTNQPITAKFKDGECVEAKPC